MFESTTSPRLLRPLIGATAILMGAGAFAAMPTVVPQAGATAAVVTYQANTTQPGALTGSFPATANSDGWAVALNATQVFNVTHHQPTIEVTCHNQVDGSLCWPSQPTKTVTSGSLKFVTSVGPGLHMDQATGHLFTFAVETDGIAADNTAGVVCIDTSKPVSATGAQLFCGFTPLSAKGDAVSGLAATLSAPVMAGSNWYSFNAVAGVGAAAGAGTENTLLCFNTVTLAACTAKSIGIPLNGIVTASSGRSASPGPTSSFPCRRRSVPVRCPS